MQASDYNNDGDGNNNGGQKDGLVRVEKKEIVWIRTGYKWSLIDNYMDTRNGQWIKSLLVSIFDESNLLVQARNT